MEKRFIDLLNDDEEDILAKVQEESLRFYKEVEIPRLQLEKQLTKEYITEANNSDELAKPSCSSSQKEKEEALLYEGEEAFGFHLEAGTTYVYPTNYPVRRYQSSITRTALFQNTLVSLPTGLGKTFIAAVVMYNYYRWYPKGKVVFLAPTRPLVAQQIKACHHIMNIPISDTTEMTGMNNAEQRRDLWKEKRVFYLTPQVMVNDLKSNICHAELIKCVVFDEAHRAIKDYAYCQIVKLLMVSGCYRTLALSATPGSDINAVQQVIRNLNISALEIRGEDALDVSPYIHTKSVEKIVVELSPNILRVKEDFLQIYEKYARRLKDNKALTSNISYLTKFQVLKACERFRSNPPRGINPTVLGSLICDFTVCITLAHSLELLQSYGLRAFHSYLTIEGGEKSKAATNRLKKDEDLQKMLIRLGEILYPKTESAPYTWGHPKLQRLMATVTEHFNNFKEKNESTKVIVFCQYRVVVNEIVEILQKCSNIKPAIFIGQSGGKEKGMPQSKQLQIMKEFREGSLNCLVATCVAEEGLDIGEVDLILLMETHKSPVRLVQRLGRTGRKRKGRCVILLTSGKELEKFQAVMAARKDYVNTIINSYVVKSSLSKTSPSMIPHDVVPQQQLVHLNVINLVTPTKKKINKQVDIRNCFAPESSPFLSVDQFNELKSTYGDVNLNLERLPKPVEMWPKLDTCKKMSIEELLNGNVSRLSSWNDWNLEKQPTYFVNHTKETEILCHLLFLSRNSKELKFLYNDTENEVIKQQSDKTKEKECKENEKVKKQNEKVVPEIREERLEGKTLKTKRKESMKNRGKMLDIRSCMSVAATRLKLSRITNEVFTEISDDELPHIKDDCKQAIFFDNIFELFELDKKKIGEINSGKYLLEYQLGKDSKLHSRLAKYMLPKKFKFNYYSIVPNASLPEIDVLTKNLCNLLNQSGKMLKNIQQSTKDFSPKEREHSSMEFSDLVNLDDLFSNEDNLGDSISKSSIRNFEINDNDSKKESPNNSLLNTNLKYFNNNTLCEIKKTPSKDPILKTEPFSEKNQEIKKYDFNTSEIFCSTPLQFKKTNCEKQKSCTNENNEGIMEEDGVWNLSDLFNDCDLEVNVNIDLVQKVSIIKEEFFKEEGSPEVNNLKISPNIVVGNVNQVSKESPDITRHLYQVHNISSERTEINQNIYKINDCKDIIVTVNNDYTKPNFSVFNNSNDSTLSDFTFNSRDSKLRSKPNFKTFKKKQILKTINSTENNLVSKDFLQTNNINEAIHEIIIKQGEQKIDISDTCSNGTITEQSDEKLNSRNKLDNYKLLKKLSLKRKLIIDSDEDDVFEVSSKVKYKRKIRLNSSFEKSPVKKLAKKLKGNGFIEKEAEVSGIISTDDSDNSSLDDVDDSFINDENQTINETHTEYLRSVKSPRAGGKFKIPVGDQIPDYNMEIYSQRIEQDSSYINDSFCVNSSEESESNDISLLEFAELLLEEKKRRKHRKNKNGVTEKISRYRIIQSPVSQIGEVSKARITISSGSSSSEGPSFSSLEKNYKSAKNRKRMRIIQSDSEGESQLKQM